MGTPFFLKELLYLHDKTHILFQDFENMTTQEFIERARGVHGERYDYSKTEFTQISYKVVVGCPEHGDFEIIARDLLNGKGCQKCAKRAAFIKRLEERFGQKFSYEKLEYVDAQTPVELVCPVHGPFLRTPANIMGSSCGCPECATDKVKQTQTEALVRRVERQREDAELTIYESAKEAEENQHKYLSACDISNFWTLECLMRRFDNRSIKKLIQTLEWELERRPANEGKSRVRFDRHNVKTCKSFVAIDFETLYAQRVSACSVGMVKYVDGEIADRYYSLIRPPFDYPGKRGMALTWVHGFTEEMLLNERAFDEILPEIEAFVDGLPLVAHNCNVERGCIREAAAYYGLSSSLDIENILDTYPTSHVVEEQLAIVVEGAGTHSLDAVCRRFGIEEKHHHNALDDAEMCGNLMIRFHKILAEHENMELPQIEPALFIDDPVIFPVPKIKPEDKIQRADLENIIDNPFKDKVVVLTGFAKTDSQQYAHLLNELGAIIRDSVNKKTNILITGYNAGPSKLKKAEELGVQIMQEAELKEILNQIQP